jgi:hypothetical protein
MKHSTCAIAAALLVSADITSPVMAQPQTVRTQRPVTDLTRPNTAPAVRAVQPQLSDVLSRPADQIVVAANGHRLTVQQVRDRLNAPNQISATQTDIASPKVPEVRDLTIVPGGRFATRSVLASEVNLARASAASMVQDCTTRGPSISRIRGTLRPGEVITISGSCLSAQAGELRLFGDFAARMYQMPIHFWNDSSIVTQMPQGITGVGAIPVRFEVVTVDRKATRPLSATFTPVMELVDVTRFWTGNCRPSSGSNSRILCQNNSIDSMVWGCRGAFCTGQPPLSTAANRWSIKINSNCVLGQPWWNRGRGNVIKFDGWDEGPPHESNVTVTGAPEEWVDEGFWVDTYFYGFSYALGANAYCPVGISPQP